MQPTAEPTAKNDRSTAETTVRPTEPRQAADHQRPKLVRYATPAAMTILVSTALLLAYVVAVVPMRLAVLLAIWIGSMGLLIALPFLLIVGITTFEGRRARHPTTGPDERSGPAGRRPT